jgi:hypothetical protein
MIPRPERQIVTSGIWGVVEFAIDAQLRCPAREYLDGLPALLGDVKKNGKPGLGNKAQAKFVALFQEMADFGRITKQSRFRKEADVFFGFKYEVQNHLLRFPCFAEGNRRWVLTHGFDKDGDKWRDEDIERAKRIMKEHLSIFSM